MDVLSEVLKVVKLQGAMFYNGEFSAPWSFRSPPSCNVAPFVAVGAEHVIIYHLLTEGHASARLEDGERLDLDAGDVVIFPHGDPHIIENGRPIKSVDLLQELARIFSQGLRLARSGGGGEVTKFVCGHLLTDNPEVRSAKGTSFVMIVLRSLGESVKNQICRMPRSRNPTPAPQASTRMGCMRPDEPRGHFIFARRRSRSLPATRWLRKLDLSTP
jgi:hypothetical protein